MKRDINTPIEKMKFFQPLDKEGQPVVQYDDGTFKKLGQKRNYEGQPQSYIVRTKKNDVYLVEKPKKAKKGRKKRFFQDGEEVKKPFTEKEQEKRKIEFLKENKVRQDYHEEDLIEAEWKRIYSPSQVPKSFYMTTKFNKDLNQDFIPKNVPQTPYHLFRLFFDDRIYKLIVRETNNYKHQAYLEELQKCPPDKNPPREPLDYDTIDLDGYLSILICMGVQQMRCPKDYWKRNNFTHNEIACIMKYSKFEQLDKYLHLANNQDPKIANDIIGKVREYLGYMNENFKKYYYPGEFLSIDEGMIPFTGRVSFKVYNPDKPNKFGIKEFVCCDAQNAYTLETQLYHGNHESEQFPEVTLSKTNEGSFNILTNILVMNLLKDYEHRFHKVVMDNYYNSPTLFYIMKEKAFGGLGTMRIGRLKLPPHLLSQIMEVHQNKVNNFLLSYVQGDINLAIFFRGTNDKEICLMSNFLDQKLVKHNYWKILADVKEDRDIYKEQSQMSAYYNKYKGGVDRRNSFLAMYRNKRRNYKWWRPVFYRMLDNAIVNAFILYNFNKSPSEKISQKDFRVQLFKTLASRYSPPKSELAINELRFMKDISEEVNQTPHYFEKKMKHHILKNCNYSAHTLVKSRSDKKLCVECKSQTLFSCSTCSKMFKMKIAVCSAGFNQCYDFHSSKSYEEIIDKLFIKKRSDGRAIKIENKKRKKLIKISDLHNQIMSKEKSNNNKQKPIPQRTVTLDYYLQKKNFLEDEILPQIEKSSSNQSFKNSTAAKTAELLCSSNSSQLLRKKDFKIVKGKPNQKPLKSKSCDIIFQSDSKSNSDKSKTELADNKEINLFESNKIVQKSFSLSDSQKSFSENIVVIDKSPTDEEIINNNTDEDIIWVEQTLAKLSNTTQKFLKSQTKIQMLDDAFEAVSSSSSLNHEKLRRNYIELPFTFGHITEVDQEKESDDEITKEYKIVTRRLEQIHEDTINNNIQFEDSNYFPESVDVKFFDNQNLLQGQNDQGEIDNNKTKQNNITIKQEHKELQSSAEKKKKYHKEQLEDCENLLNNAIDYSDYDFTSEEEYFEYKGEKKNKRDYAQESDSNQQIIHIPKKKNKFIIDDDNQSINDDLKIDRKRCEILINSSDCDGDDEEKEQDKRNNYLVIGDDGQFEDKKEEITQNENYQDDEDEQECIQIPLPQKKIILPSNGSKRVILVKKQQTASQNTNIIYINNKRFKIVKQRATINIDSD